MEIRHEWEHGPELLFGECNGDAARNELKILEPILNAPEGTGTAHNPDGTARKNNRGIFLDQVYTPLYADCSPTVSVLDTFINTAKAKAYTPNSVFQTLYSMDGYTVLFSAYKDGDYYKPHRDASKLTILLWLGEKDFDGGNLYLPDFDYTIPYQPNKLIMFPSYYRHEVTKIRANKGGFVRYCASAFIN